MYEHVSDNSSEKMCTMRMVRPSAFFFPKRTNDLINQLLFKIQLYFDLKKIYIRAVEHIKITFGMKCIMVENNISCNTINVLLYDFP